MTKSKGINVLLIVFSIIIVGLLIGVVNVNLNKHTSSKIEQISYASDKLNKVVDEYQDNVINLEISADKLYNDKILLDDFLQVTDLTISSDNKVCANGFEIEINSNYVSTYVKNGISQKYINYKLALTDLGFEYFESEQGLDIGRKFATKRLIVKEKDKKVNNIYKAKEKINFLNYVILQYETEYQAYQAYNKLLLDCYSVSIDNVLELDASVDSDITVTEINGDDYHSWGGRYMDFATYNNYLLNKYQSLPEVVVAVIDTGINNKHEVFKDKLIGIEKNFCSGYDNQNEAIDDNGHGTHVAGVIAELTTPNVKILPIKVMNKKGIGYSSNTLLAYEYVLEMKNKYNICAINCSFGFDYLDESYLDKNSIIIKDLLGTIADKNIVCVVAGGNSGTNVDTHFPASIDNVITVGNMKSNEELSSSSNYGFGIDVVAPGTNILSSYFSDYSYKSGTSMACPHITAAVALLYSDKEKNYNSKTIELALKTILCVDLGTPGYDEKFGYGAIKLTNAGHSTVNNLKNKVIQYDFIFESNINLYYEDSKPLVSMNYLALNNSNYALNALQGKKSDSLRLLTLSNNFSFNFNSNDYYEFKHAYIYDGVKTTYYYDNNIVQILL